MSKGVRRTSADARTRPPFSYISPPLPGDPFVVMQSIFKDVPARNRFARHTLEAGRAARAALPQSIGRIRAIVGEVDSPRVYAALHVTDAMRRAVLRGPENFGSDAMLEFFAGLITSIPEPEILKRIDSKFDVRDVWTIETILREIANLQAGVDFASALDRPLSPRQSALRLIQSEQHFDRMSGFDGPLRRVVKAVFDQVDDYAAQEVGFKLSDSLRFADAYGRRRNAHGDQVSELLERHYPAPPASGSIDEVEHWMIGHVSTFVVMAAAAWELEIDEELSEQLGMTDGSFNRMVAAMATPLGSQQVDGLGAGNSLRTRPILRMSSGEWMWCRPSDFIHGALDWAFEICRDSSRLLDRFDRARQDIAEKMPAEILSNVFGRRVFSNVHYTMDGARPDIDALVALPGAAIITECKGGRFTAPARRGAPGRVETHAKQIVDKAANQNARTMRAIAAGVRLETGGKHAVVVGKEDLCLSIIVTLDRVDPFSTHLGQPSERDNDHRSWVVALSDLVMIAQILPTAAEFFAYLRDRVTQVRTESHLVLVEADALGAWCDNRMTVGRPLAPGHPIVVDTTSDAMNKFFTDPSADAAAAEGHDALDAPSTHIPPEVLHALDRLLESESPCWAERAVQAASLLPKEWDPLRRLIANSCRPDNALSRDARKKQRRARHGYMLAGKVPVRLGPRTEEDHEYLVIQDCRVAVAGSAC